MSIPVPPTFETIQDIHARAGEHFATGQPGPSPASSSPLSGRVIFLVGAPRSGTTWLQQLLATHPDVATSGESHVFCEGVDALFRNHAGTDPTLGISTWVDETTLTCLVRSFVDGLFESARSTLRPGATRILDKTPNHVPYAASAARVYPDAAFIHLIRDGRDVATSAHRFWGVNSAWSTAGQAARTWSAAIMDNRQHLGPLRYHEVRYEDLVAQTERYFVEILDVLSLEHDPGYVDAAVAFCRSPVNIRPSGGGVRARKWELLSREAEREILMVAGDLLVELGYLTEEERRASRRSPRALAHIAGRRARLLARRARTGAKAMRTARRLERRRAVHRTATSLAELLAGGVAPGDQLFHPWVVLEESGFSRSGSSEVTARLRQLAQGARVLRVDADETAAAIYLLDGAGCPRLLTCTVAEGQIDRVAVHDGA